MRSYEPVESFEDTAEAEIEEIREQARALRDAELDSDDSVTLNRNIFDLVTESCS